jgi:chromosome segregation ATPase
VPAAGELFMNLELDPSMSEIVCQFFHDECLILKGKVSALDSEIAEHQAEIERTRQCSVNQLRSIQLLEDANRTLASEKTKLEDGYRLALRIVDDKETELNATARDLKTALTRSASLEKEREKLACEKQEQWEHLHQVMDQRDILDGRLTETKEEHRQRIGAIKERHQQDIKALDLARQHIQKLQKENDKIRHRKPRNNWSLCSRSAPTIVPIMSRRTL